MLKIRLQRIGRKNHAEFRVVVTDSHNGPKSSYLELVGTYNPHTNLATFESERITYWIQTGAQVSDTVHNLLVKHAVINAPKKRVIPKKKEVVVAAPTE